MLKKVGFIGLGQMGKWMALNLLRNSIDLMVYDIDAKAMDSGWGHEDKGAMFKVFEKVLDVKFRKRV